MVPSRRQESGQCSMPTSEETALILISIRNEVLEKGVGVPGWQQD